MSKEICECQLSPMDEILKTECDCKDTPECGKCLDAWEYEEFHKYKSHPDDYEKEVE